MLCPGEQRRKRRTMEEARDALTREIREAVGLSGEQEGRVRTVLQERLTEIRRLRRELMMPHMEEQLALLDRQVTAVLRQDQKPAWSEFLAEKQKLWFPPEPDTQPATTTAPS